MDVILHLGAHRTGSTSFQRYMRHAMDQPQAQRAQIGFWGPLRTRDGLLHGIHDFPLCPKATRRAKGRLKLQIAGAERRGVRHLVISDENMIGTPRTSFRCGQLYPEVGTRLARLHAALDGRISRVVLQIRALDSYWASLLAFSVTRGAASPDPALAERLARGLRSWRDVVTDLSCALPGVEIIVTPFERFVQRPDLLLGVMTDLAALPPVPPGGIWANRSPDLPALRSVLSEANPTALRHLPTGVGRWHPFTAAQTQRLQSQHSADLTWLRNGADGLATYLEDLPENPASRAGHPGKTKRGSEDHDCQDRQLARAGRERTAGQTA